jgi:hypothetical protein
MDLVLEGPENAENLLIVTSACHGIEGYCGSAVQSGILEFVPVDLSSAAPDTAVLHVHAANPHGFSHTRRVTNENVDLNRNFVDFSAPLPINPGYADIHQYLLPESWPPSAQANEALESYRQRVGDKAFQCAVSLGQYAFDNGLFFGGKKPTWSNVTFREVLQRYGRNCKHIGWIDIHTGLGPYGIGERIFASPEDQSTVARAREWWGSGITSVHTGSSSSIPLTGAIQFALPEECPQAESTNICLEFGSRPSDCVREALRADHWLQQHPECPVGLAADIKRNLRDAFYPEEDQWKQMVWQQAREAYVQAIYGLVRQSHQRDSFGQAS